MRAVGIIAEYNPFHSGHAYQLDRARALSGADMVIVAMSGAFTQRGEPALLDKWTRARMALMNGADMVFELPCLFALREARGFAEGGVRLLNGLGIVDALCFGCEPELMHLIEPVSRCLSDEPEDFRAHLRAALDEGKSYPRARAEAASLALGLDKGMLDKPNFALALEYAQANARLLSPMRLLPIARTSDFHGLDLGSICSASAIRAAIARGEAEKALMGMPGNCRALLMQALDDRDAQPADAPCALKDSGFLDELALFMLRTLMPEGISRYPGVSEGLENLLFKQARACTDAEAVLAACKSRRYTMSRLRRLLPQIALGITSDLQRAHPAPTYARLLGCRREALGMLGEIKRRGTLELATDARALDGSAIWQLETRATDLWGQLTDSQNWRRAGRDYTHRLVVVD